MKFLNIINAIVFLFITVVVASIFYEGLTLKWYSFVPILMITTDVLFILATILNLICNRKNKLIFRFNIFSAIFIVIALISKFAGIKHPEWAGTIWHFYILFLYGTQVIIFLYKHFVSKAILVENKK
jgi:hypothetical protein